MTWISLEVAAAAMQAEATGDEQEALAQRLADLRRWRAAEGEARGVLAPLGQEPARRWPTAWSPGSRRRTGRHRRSSRSTPASC